MGEAGDEQAAGASLSPSTLGLFLIGLVLMLGGAELLVRGASRLAGAFGISPLVIGLTVVAWGTGSPELAVGLKAALAGSPALTIGNVVGSNIANILLILGVAALLVPLTVAQRLIQLHIPLMIGVSVLTLLVSLDGRISTFEGLIFVSLLVGYTAWTIHESRRTRRATIEKQARELGEEAGPDAPGWGLLVAHGAMIPGGLFLLIKGSDLLVESASALARAFGLSDLLIGLTIVAIGTSLPELATSAIAAAKGERDIAVGNAIGSNIFNLLAVLGITAIVAPGGIEVPAAALIFDIPIMIAVAIACLPVFFAGYIIDRRNGALFLALYAVYIAYLVLEGTQHWALGGFTAVVLMFMLPLVVFTMVLLAYQGWRKR